MTSSRSPESASNPEHVIVPTGSRSQLAGPLNESNEISEPFRPFWQKAKSVHPGHVMLLASLPFCIGTYRLSRKPLGTLVEHVANLRSNGQLKNMSELSEAEENIKRAVGVAVAARALSLATLGCFGAFGLFSSAGFYASSCSTIEEAVQSARDWGHERRKKLDQLLNVDDRVDRDHPEMLSVRDMTEEEEYQYVSKRYFSSPDVKQDPELTSDQETTAASEMAVNN